MSEELFVFPASFGQARLWFLDRLEPGNPAYNVAGGVRIRGALNRHALEEAVLAIVRRHEVLRTTFVEVDGEPAQVVGEEPVVDMRVSYLKAFEPKVREAELARLAMEASRAPFDLAAGPLLRACLFALSDDEHVFVLVMHHIVSDLWSVGVFFRELFAFYEAFARGAAPDLPELPIQYADYADWQRRSFEEDDSKRAELEYWKQKLAGPLPRLTLPIERPAPSSSRTATGGARVELTLDAELTAALERTSRSRGKTLFMTMFSAFQALLYRYSGQEDIVVGTVVANRARPELSGLIGAFVNTLALRNRLSGDEAFSELLDRVGELSLEAFAHQDLPFEKLVEELAPERHRSRNPLFRVMFAFQNAPLPSLALSGLTLSEVAIDRRAAPFDLSLFCREMEGELLLIAEYATECFDEDGIRKMLEHYRLLLEGVVSDPKRSIAQLLLVSAEERKLVLDLAHPDEDAREGRRRESPSVLACFAEQARKKPDALALASRSSRLSYRELHGLSDRIAGRLLELGISPEDRVAIFCKRSPLWVAAQLGVMKAGGAFVPLDPAVPTRRLLAMLEDASVSLVLTELELRDHLPEEGCKVIALESAIQERYEEADALSPDVSEDRLAYVIFTSGSTGRPKGVAVPHRGLANLVAWHRRAHEVACGDRAAQVAGLGFDASVWEVWPYLSAGASVHFPDEETLTSPTKLSRWLRDERITITFLPTPLAEIVVELKADDGGASPTLRRLLTGGDRLHRAPRPELGYALYNQYGPTENAVVTTSCRVDPRSGDDAGEPPSIGRPIDGSQVRVLDPAMELVPLGLMGELYIGGEGLARGYLDDPETTAERFVPDPFAEAPGARLYRTGDLVRMDENGSLHFQGRADGQVKIRGFRIELSEIEIVLASHPDVRDAVVLLRAGAGEDAEKQLVAHVTGSATNEALRSHLASRLPEYMVPAAFMRHESFPLSANGKVDRRALAELEPIEAREEGYVPPRGPLEEVLAEIWAESLGIDRGRVGAHDSFFALGGHSLAAVKVLARIRDSFGAELPLHLVFDSPRLGELASRIAEVMGSAKSGPSTVPIVALEPSDPNYRRLSFAQQRLWLMDRFTAGDASYTVSAAHRLTGRLEPEALEASLTAVVARHEALRTTIDEDGKRQIVSGAEVLTLTRIDLSGADEPEREALRLAEEQARRPMDLVAGPLFTCTLLKLSAERHVLLWKVHHIVTDAWSIGIFYRELAASYRAHVKSEPLALPPVRAQYSDFAAWQARTFDAVALESTLDYWREVLSGELLPTELPTDGKRGVASRHRGARLSRPLPPDFAARLRELGKRHGVTAFMTLLAVFELLLARYSGRDDVVVGTPVANRTRREIENTIGLFVNMLVLRVDLSGNPTFVELLSRVRERSVGAFTHQEIPFERLVAELRPERRSDRTPFFQAAFAFQNALEAELELEGLEITTLPVELTSSRFDFELHVWERDSRMGAVVSYDADLYDEATVARVLEQYEALVEAALATPESPLHALSMMSSSERRTLLEGSSAPSAYERETTLDALLRAQAERTPEAAALRFGDATWTYRELLERAGRLAAKLRALGVGPDVRVGIYGERSLELYASVVGVTLAGGAYVPIDPSYPPSRVRFIVEDAKLAVIVTSGPSDGTLSETGVPVVRWEEAARDEAVPVQTERLTASHLAYVVYTSGSTGKPKGVAVTHRGVSRLVCNTNYIRLTARDRVAQAASFAFDAATFELWGALLSGACLVGFDKNVTLEPRAFGRELERSGVTVLFLTTALFNVLVREAPRSLDALRVLLFGGELVDVSAVRACVRSGGPKELLHVYGPTESTTFASFHRVTSGVESARTVPIGTAIASTELYVVDDDLELCPTGVPGELLIGGDGLARGYVDRPGLTASSFVPHPWGAPGERLYRTGDVVRRLASGFIEFIGRRDGQIKLRGHRIELGEVEAVIAEHPAVAAATVALRRARGEARLVAYVVWREGEAPREEVLREHLRERVSEVMVPSFFVALSALPLTPNGKIDREALPDVAATEPGGGVSEPRSEAPRDRVEKDIAVIWRELLKSDAIGIDDNFFDVGGHSLLIVALHRQLNERYPDAAVAVVELFQNPTIRTLARRVRGEEVAFVEGEGLRESSPGALHEPIAIVGVAGRFPRARTVEELWQNLCEGRESITFFDEDELRGSVDERLLEDPAYVRARGVMDDAELFDATFFGYNAREAEILDPQQRVFLEVAWEALERAGLAHERYRGRVGVFAGSSANTYAQNLLGRPDLIASVGTFLPTISNDKDFLATRVSYKLNLRGPSVAVQTACSTSLVAVHFACQSLRLSECDVALAGGVSIGSPRKRGYLYSPDGIQSKDGHCRAFDAASSGTVAGEGAGVVVLKRLSDALEAGDRIEAVIRGSAINNDGSLKVGYTAPSVEGQREVLTGALALAGVAAESLDYVETHGTGTALGDPIEVAALRAAFGDSIGGRPLGLGSIKTNLGHLDAAAGVTSLIKTALALREEAIPPSLHFEEANPELGLDASRLYVNRELRAWPRDEARPRRAGVSSFGIGGTNAHVVLEEAPHREPSSSSPRRHEVLLWSAKSREAADRLTASLGAHVEAHPDESLADVAFTLATGRSRFAHRRLLVIGGRSGVALRSGRDRVEEALDDTEGRDVAFVFPGQGSQFVDMARQLYEADVSFRETCDRGFELLKNEHALDVRPLVFPSEGDEARARAAMALRETRVTQPLLFIIEHALASRLISFGVTPSALLGHSLGEYVAASIAGVFDFETGVALTALRGRMMQSAPRGAMSSVAITEEAVRERLPEGLSVAAVNAERLIVVSGATAEIEVFERELADEGIAFRRLETSHAFHSQLMDSVAPRFEEALREVSLKAPRIPLVSNVTGTWLDARDATDPAYWARHLREPVRFAEGVSRVAEGGRAVLEVGPGRVIAGELRRLVSVLVPTIGSGPGVEGRELSEALGRLWLAGVTIDWNRYFEGERRHRVLLPTYPFERERYWVERRDDETKPAIVTPRAASIADWFYVPSWMRSLARRALERQDGDRHDLWLVFRDPSGLGRAMAERLGALGREVVEVDADGSFELRPDGTRILDLREPSHYERLFSELRDEDRLPTHVIWARNVAPSTDGDDTPATRAELATRAFTRLARALVTFPGLEKVRLAVVTHGAQAVLPGDELVPESSALLGAARVLPQEHTNVTCLALDVAAADGTAWQPEQVDPLLADIAAGGNTHVAYRGLGRFVESAVPIDPFELDVSRPAPLRGGGTYLITGGLGNVGLAIAEHLAESTHANLVLVSRRPLTKDDRARLERVEALQERSAVLVETADVTLREAMEAVFRKAEERFGRVDGVVHAAGVTGARAFRTLGELEDPDLTAQFDAKGRGVEVLEAVLRDRAVDFCLLCSSLSVALGGLGFTAYASANRFMDAFTERMVSRGKPWLAIDWDGWAFREAEPSEASLGGTLRHLVMSPSEGVATFDRALRLVGRTDVSSVIVSTGELESRRRQWLSAEVTKPEPPTAVALERRARPVLRSAFEAPTTPLETRIAAIWQELLGVEIGIDDDFFELGGHSLLATQIVSRLRQANGIDVPLGRFLVTPTVRRLAAFLEGQAPSTSDEPSAAVARPEGSTPSVERPLSFAQQRLWFFEQMTPGSATYNFSQPCRHEGPLDARHLREALRHLIERHETLRTSFVTVSGEPRQIVHAAETTRTPFAVVDLEGLAPGERERQALELARLETETPFDLAGESLIRLTLITLGPSEQILLVTMHHIVTDGWSLRIFFEELSACYDAALRGLEPELPALAIQYAEFAAWQRRWLEGAKLEAHLRYWTARLEDAPAALELPTDRPRPVAQTFRGARVSRLLPAPLAEGLRRLSSDSKATLFMTLLAVFETLLHRLSGESDLVIGTPVAGRNRAETEGLIGFFINTLVLRTDLSGAPSFDALLNRVKTVCLEAYDHQDVPFEKVVEAVAPERDLGRTPLFQVMFNLLNFERRERGSASLVLEGLAPGGGAESGEPWNPDVDSKFDLTLYASERPEGMNLLLVYNADLFDRSRMVELLAQYEALASQIVSEPSRSVTELSLVTEAARKALPDPCAPLSNGDSSGFSGGALGRILNQARMNPARVALVDAEGSLDYGTLGVEVRRLARHMQERGVRPDEIVAIYAARRRELVVAMLAIWEAGASFVMLDPRYPAASLARRVAVAHPTAWVRLGGTPEPSGALVEALARVPVGIDLASGLDGLPRDMEASDDGERNERDTPRSPERRAYLAFTSGSTGEPKGVVGTHAPLDHFVAWQIERFGLDEKDRFAMLSGLAYDPLLRDVLTPLTAGATLAIPSEGVLTDGSLLEWLSRESITAFHATPSLVRMLLGLAGDNEEGPLASLRYAFVGGERLLGDDVRRLRTLAPSVQCVNLYGTTETPQGMAHRVATCADEERTSVPLGKGIDGAQLLVLGPSGLQAGIGELGEIHVRSPYLSRGYWNDEALTVERFVENPFAANDPGRLYRTGDLGRYLPDGAVVFHGRRDHQVKLRGHRVELGEIEVFLRKHPSAERSLVLCRENAAGEARLVAYLEGPPLAAPARAELEQYLAEKLPDFMIPTAFVCVDAFPLSPSGKIDVKALPSPERPASEGFVEPRNAVERVVAALWAELLEVERVSVRDDFFELGGHSLLATQLISRLRDVLDARLSLKVVFESPTVEGMVQALAENPVERERLEQSAELVLKLAAMTEGEVAGVLDETTSTSTSGAGGR